MSDTTLDCKFRKAGVPAHIGTGRPGKSFATGIEVHISGMTNALDPMGEAKFALAGKPISMGCQTVCSKQYHDFEQATGLDAVPAQQQFTVIIDTLENQ